MGEGCEKDSKEEKKRALSPRTKPRETRQLTLTLPFSTGPHLNSPGPFLPRSHTPPHLCCFIIPVEGRLVVAEIEDFTFDL